ncbi:MAG: MFS transporter [Clostridiales bacterium]|nr:MFS transporter [Clostridiales bacterium]
MDQIKLNRRYTRQYSAIQGSYWMSTCASVSYVSVYLLDRGYSNSEIGVIIAISNILAVILQPLVASFTDRHKKLELRKLLSGFSGSMILMAGVLVFITTDSMLLSILMVYIATITMVIQPLMNSLSMAYEKSGIFVNYGFARGIGSIAYAALSTSLGLLLRHFTTILIPICICMTAIAFTVFVYFFKDCTKNASHSDANLAIGGGEQQEKASSLHEFVKKNPRFILLLLGVFFIFYNHQTLSVFTIQVIEGFGGTSREMGIANSIAAMSEFPAMFMVNRLLKKYNCRTLIRFAAITFAVKHLIILSATSVPVFFIAQVFQIGSYAILIPVSVTYVSKLLKKVDAVKGQAFMTSAITLSSVFASMINGRLLDVTSVHNVILIGTIVAWIGSIIVFFSVERVEDEIT